MNWVTCLFPPKLQNIITPKPLEQELEILTQCSPSPMSHMTHAICHMSHVRYQVSDVRFYVSGVASKYQTIKPRELTFWDKFHLPPPITCHLSHIMCLVSRVTCHVSCGTCHMWHVFFLYIIFLCVCVQSGQCVQWRVCYQRGLLRLVSWESAIDCTSIWPYGHTAIQPYSHTAIQPYMECSLVRLGDIGYKPCALAL